MEDGEKEDMAEEEEKEEEEEEEGEDVVWSMRIMR